MRSRALLPYAPLFVLFTLGCGRSAEERQLDAMRAEIESVRQNRDQADHVDGTHETPEPLVVPQAYAAPVPARVPPSVVEIGSDGQGALDDASEADPQDTTPRPTIRVLGSTRGAGRNGWRVEDQIETSAELGATAPPGAPQRSSTLDPEAKRAYDAAYSLVSARRFDEALDALASFLVKWPDHPYANNAMYWRGECYFARGDYQHASEQFDGMLRRYPAGAKAPDSLLKLGMSHQKLGNVMKAKESFDRLQQLYPGSGAARRIPTMRDPPSSVPSAPGPSPEEHR
jgi:tol-pal system protein YbgF